MDIDDLRRKVERKRLQEEIMALKNEYYGRNKEIDENVIYMTTSEVSKYLGISKTMVNSYVHDGRLTRSIMSKASKGCGQAWVHHPEEVDRIKRIRELAIG